MSQDQTQLWKQAIEIYKGISELSIADAILHVDSIHNLSYELKQAVITLVNSGNQASEYIDKNFSPQLVEQKNREINYKVGDDLADYHLLEELGKGGMSYVFKAKRKDVEPQKLVAIKIFSPKSYSPQLLKHFISEQTILSELSHPNIVDMLHGGKTEDETTYLVMELIEKARPINDYCKKLKTKQKINYILQCAQALAYSHSNLIIHRDLKPDNILIDKNGLLKIVDFGIAKLINNDIAGNKTTIMALTPNYAAPEQINSEKISTKTDIFSLAVVALELVFGEKFLPKDRLIKSCEKDEQAIDSTLKKLTVDKDLKNILHKALAQEPKERYASMQSFADDMENYLNNLPVTATSQSLFYRLGKFAKRRKALFISLMALLTTLIASLVLTLHQNQKIRIESAKAQNVKAFMLETFSQSNPDYHAGATITAKDLLNNAVNKLEKNSALQDDVKFELYQSLGMAYDQLGLANEALDLFRKAINLKPNNPIMLAYLAQALFDTKQQKEFEQLLSRVDETQFDDFPQAKFSLARVRNLTSKGQTKAALALLSHVKKLPKIQKNTALMSELTGMQAGAYFMQSDYKKVEQVLVSALKSYDLPDNHSIMLSTQLDMGILYNAMGEYDKSLNIFLKIEPLYLETMGASYPELGQLYLKMASDYLAKGQLNQAQVAAQKCYETYVRIYGKKGAQVARAMNMLAVIHKRNFEIDKTIGLLEDAIDLLNQSYDADYPLTLDLKKNLANNYLQKGQNQKALTLLQQVHKIQLKKLGENNDATLSTENSLVLALLKLNKTEEAKQLGESTLTKITKTLPIKHRLNKSIRFNLARVYDKKKDFKKRLELLLEIETLSTGSETNPDYPMILLTIGQAYNDLDKTQMAENYFLKALEANTKIYSGEHIQALQLKLQYAKFLKQRNKGKQVKKITQEVKKIIVSKNYHNAKLDKWLADLDE